MLKRLLLLPALATALLTACSGPSADTAAPAARLAYFEQQQQVLAGVSRQYSATLDSAALFTSQHPAPAKPAKPGASATSK